MLRKNQPSTESYGNYFEDSSLTPLSTTHSAFNNFLAGVGQNALMVQDVASALTGVPMEDQNLRNTLNSVELENKNPYQMGFGDVLTSSVSNMIGSGLGTGFLGKIGARGLGMVFGKVGSKVLPAGVEAFTKKPLTRVFGENVAQYLPKKAVEEGEKTLTVGEAGLNLTSAYGAGAGFVLPQAVTENYDADRNTLNWGGIAKESLIYGGGVGLAIDVFPYTAGVIWGKTKGLMGDLGKMPMPGELEKVVPHEVLSGEESGAQYHGMLDGAWKAHQAGKISLDEYKWWRDYLVNPSNLNDMKQRAVSILMKDGHPVDAGQMHVMLNLMKPEDANNFLTGVADQLGSAVDQQADSALSEYVVNNGLDRLQSDPKLISGLRGFYDFMQDKLSKKPEHLGRVERTRETGNFDHINNDHPFSQKMIYTAIKNGADQVPHTVPENVTRRVQQEERLKDVQDKHQRYSESVLPPDLLESKKSTEKEFTSVQKETQKSQRALDSSIEKLGKHEAKITEINEKLKSETKEKKIKDLQVKLEQAISTREEFTTKNKALSQSLKFAKAQENNVKAKLETINRKINEHRDQLAKQGKSVQIFDRIKRLETKMKDIRSKMENILHPDDELKQIEKSLIKDDGLPKNFRSTKEYQRLHDLAQVSDRAKMLLHHVELLREYEKQEGYKNIADLMIQLSEKGFRQLADGDRVVSYLKNRVEQASGLKPKIEEKAEAAKAPDVPQDAEKLLEEQAKEQKTESEAHKEAYDQAKSKFDEFKKSESIFKNFINCVMGSTDG